jgi:uncharacterized cupin superfamily protein
MNMQGPLDISSVFSFRDEPLDQPERPIDPSVVISGTPWEKTGVLYVDARGEFTVGVWESSPGAWRVITEEDEYVRVLRGQIRIADEAGNTKTYGPNESFFVPERFHGTWENIGEVRKIFVSLKRKRG